MAMHPKRGLDCPKGGSIVLRWGNLVYMPGQKEFKRIITVPTRGKFWAWNGFRFAIPITTVQEANDYINNETLFPSRKQQLDGTFKFDPSLRRSHRFMRPRFQYFAPVERDANGTLVGAPIVPKPMDSFVFEAQLTMAGGVKATKEFEVDINVVSKRPRAPRASFSVVHGAPRTVKLPAFDVDQRNIEPLREIVAASVMAPTDGSCPCTLRSAAGAPAFDFSSGQPAAVSPETLTLYVEPPKSFPSGSTCVFNYTATDRDGQTSGVGFVTITAEAEAKPRAYSSRVRLERKRKHVVFDLFAASRNVGPDRPMAFFISQLPDPAKGTVFLVKDTDEQPKPEQQLAMPTATTAPGGKPAPLLVSNTTSRRVRLIFETSEAWLATNTAVDPTGRKTPAQVEASTPAFVEYFVNDGYADSDPARITISPSRGGSPPRCVMTTIFDAVQDASSTVRLNYSYSENADGAPVSLSRIRRLQLVTLPLHPLGYLAEQLPLENGTMVRRLKVGDFFSDEDRRLLWVPDPEAKKLTVAKWDVFSWKAITPEGLACRSVLRVRVVPHKVAGGDAYNETQDRAYTSTLKIMELRPQEAGGPLTSVKFDKLPEAGTFWTVSQSLPVEQYPVVGGFGRTMLSFCRRVNCSQFKRDRIVAGAEIAPFTDTKVGYNKLLVLYEAPADVPRVGGTNHVTATYYFKTAASLDWSPKPHLLTISVLQGALPVLEYFYDPVDPGANMSNPADLRIPVAILDSRYAVQVLRFDENRRHNVAPSFRIMQLATMDGGRAVPGEPVNTGAMTMTEKAPSCGTRGFWITNNNTVVIVPEARARRKVFKFRVRAWTMTDGGCPLRTDSDAPPKVYRVIVRQRNTVPQWPADLPREYKTYTGKDVPIGLYAMDQENDLLSFRLIKAPKYGLLRFETSTLGISSSKVIHSGMTFKVRKGSLIRGLGVVHYRCDGTEKDPYPLHDELTILADDGSGVFSEPLTLKFTVEATAQALANRETRLPNPTVAIAGVVVFLLVVVFVTWTVVRRHRFKAYQALASGDAGNAPHPGVNS